MNKNQASDMIYAFFRECTEQNLCHIPLETADDIIDSWFKDYWQNLHDSSK